MPSRSGGLPSPAAALEEVRQIYRDLAARPIGRDCQLRTQCCHFILTGKTPHLTRGEALLASRAFRATGRKSLPARDDGACPLLDPRTARCLIYEDRPFGCRTHFCAAAGGPYARRDVIDLIRRLEKIDEQLGGDGPRALPGAIADALPGPACR
ncbi:MAG: YkgJ family cysteine cluster protein [Chthoniobacterales bacterium]|nr:YkgJ family cysteine cluster protein [Chthoniobacterales bacterium]